MSVSDQITRFASSRRWQLRSAASPPQLSSDSRTPRVQIPPDVLEFYELCGGLQSVVIHDSDLILSVASPQEFSWALPTILGEAFESSYAAFQDNRSSYWYLIGRGDTDEYFAIDLSSSRYGYCYFIKLYFFGQPGRIPIIADSFSKFLDMVYSAAEWGEEWSWYDLELGDAFDPNP